jgi:hypothetical protein
MRKAVVLCALCVVVSCKKEQAGTTQPTPPTTGGVAPPSTAQGNTAEPAKKNPEGCNSDFAQDLAADATLTEKCSPYTLKREIAFDGYNVTIEPGVELRFGDRSALSVGYTARSKLIAKGTAEKPIRFTALDHKEPGSWNGLTIYGNAEGTTLENVVIEYAGAADGNAMAVKAAGVTLKNVKITGAKGAGIQVTSEQPVAELSGLDLSALPADHVLSLPWTSAKAVAANNKFPANAVVDLEPAQVEADLTVPNPGVPYRTHGETDVHGKDGKTAVLTIEAGVTMQMSEDAQLDFGYEGDRAAGLKAIGTQDKPIRFVRFGDDQKSTPWNFIAFFEGSRGPELEWVTFENGGRADDGTLRFDNPRALGKISHCTFTGSHGMALFVKSAREGFTAFDENTFKDNAQAAIAIPSELAGGLGAKNTFGSGAYVEVKGDVHKDTTWAALGAPYRVIGDVTAEGGEAGKTATLKIAPGAKLVMGEGSGLFTGYSNPGHLLVGGAEQPISIVALQGKWKGVQAYEKGELKLENATIEGVDDEQAAVRLDKGSEGAVKNVTFKTKLGLRNCSEKAQSSGNKGAKDSKDGC